MDSVKQDGGTWICQLSRDGANSWIVWNANHNTKFEVPKSWNVNLARRLSGDSANFPGGKIEVGETPMLLEQAAR
jgi:8-oxo-dGTP pyrophosphatase MutT (NUDIX family)